MLNAEGGTILLGVDDRGKFVGLQAPEAIDELTAHLEQAISPKVPLRLERIEQEGRIGYLIEVPRGADAPYVYKGTIYIRTGTTNRAATAEQLHALLGKRTATDLRWERAAAVGVEAETLPVELLQKTAELYGRRYGLTLSPDPSAWDYLERLKLTVDLWPTRGAVVLFQKEPLPSYPQLGVHATCFLQDGKAETSDDRFYQGDLQELAEQAYQFCQNNLPHRSTVQGLVRRDEPILPLLAVREAIVNALMHRDYADRAQVQTRIFPDRLEVWNPGRLDESQLDAKLSLHVSRPTNPDIARVCSVWGLAELLGAGLERIRLAMAERDLPAPQWRNVQGGVLLTLAWKTATLEGGSQNLSAFNERMLACLSALEPRGILTREEYTHRFAPTQSERSARNDLSRLVSLGYLNAIGGGRGTAYVRTEKPSPL